MTWPWLPAGSPAPREPGTHGCAWAAAAAPAGPADAPAGAAAAAGRRRLGRWGAAPPRWRWCSRGLGPPQSCRHRLLRGQGSRGCARAHTGRRDTTHGRAPAARISPLVLLPCAAAPLAIRLRHPPRHPPGALGMRMASRSSVASTASACPPTSTAALTWSSLALRWAYTVAPHCPALVLVARRGVMGGRAG